MGKEVRRIAPEASNASDDANAQPDHAIDGDIDSPVVTPHAALRTQPKPAAAPTTTTRANSDARTLPSRFHSFLPGMFR